MSIKSRLLSSSSGMVSPSLGILQQPWLFSRSNIPAWVLEWPIFTDPQSDISCRHVTAGIKSRTQQLQCSEGKPLSGRQSRVEPAAVPKEQAFSKLPKEEHSTQSPRWQEVFLCIRLSLTSGHQANLLCCLALRSQDKRF